MCCTRLRMLCRLPNLCNASVETLVPPSSPALPTGQQRAPQEAETARAEAGELAELAQALRTQLECAHGLAAAAIAAQELSLKSECAARAQARSMLRTTAASSILSSWHSRLCASPGKRSRRTHGKRRCRAQRGRDAGAVSDSGAECWCSRAPL